MLAAITTEIDPRATEDWTGPHPRPSLAAGAKPVSISWKFALKAKMLSIGTRTSTESRLQRTAELDDLVRSAFSSSSRTESPSSSSSSSSSSSPPPPGSSRKYRIAAMAVRLQATIISPTELRLSSLQCVPMGTSTLATRMLTPGPTAIPRIRQSESSEFTAVCFLAGTDRAT
ncbi:unnamed protein product [Pseudo-nitzschia multistriata]|uniref:Uncharacterized protein n=1 Tax=Pseudo-nitzschia multistriata TaxID=183589 RepID=A0A448YW99_9STRA|nr:unnamed protein product [Pseudo-nitzschia multistriata]